MKSNALGRLTVILVLLILLTMPIAFAANINEAFLQGQDEIKGTSKGNLDPITFGVYITPNAGATVETSELTMLFPELASSIKFDSGFCTTSTCTDGSDTYPGSTLCLCTSTWTTLDPVSTIFTYDEGNDNDNDASKQAKLTPDVMPPVIDSIKLYQDGSDITIEYALADQGCDTCNGRCSGIKEIFITDDGSPVHTIDVESDECYISGKETFTYAAEGEKTFKITVRDNLWSSIDDNRLHAESIEKTIETDFTVPTIGSMSVTKGDEEIEFISDSGITGAKIEIEVHEKNLDTITVLLSEIGGNQDIVDVPASSYCELSETTNTCTFSNIKISGDISLLITAIDIKGNEASSTLSRSFTLDESGPKLNKLTTERPQISDDVYIGKLDNTIVAEVQEVGSGLSGADVFLNLRSLGLSQREKADRCELISGSSWQCYWEDIDIVGVRDGSDVLISRASSSKDDAGNDMTGLESTSFRYDDSAPEIIGLEIMAVGERSLRDYYQSGDILQITAEISYGEGSLISGAVADLSSLLPDEEGSDSLAGQCAPTYDDIYECTWTTPTIKSGQYVADLSFTFEDIAGNFVTKDETIAVYGIISDTPNNFEVETKTTIPSAINRMTASIMPNPPGYKIIVPFELIGSGEVDILSYEVKDCLVNDDESAYDQLFSEGRNPTPNPIPLIDDPRSQRENAFELTLRRFTADDINLLNPFDMTCSIEIYEKVGNHVYQDPEVKDFSFRIKVRDSALGNAPGEELLKEIKDAKTDVLEKTEIITKGASVMRWMESACGIANQLVGVWNAFAALENIGLGLKKAYGWEGLYKTGCFFYEGFGSLIGKLYYGSNIMSGKFSTSRCNTGIDKVENQLTGSAGVKIDPSPRNLKEALGEWEGGSGFPGLRNICGFVSCEYSTELSEKIQAATGGNIIQGSPGEEGGTRGKPLAIGDPGSFTYELGVVGTTAPPPTPQNSLIMSAANVCVPGILYNLDKYRQIQCEYIKCLKDNAEAGAPTFICNAKKSQTWCMTIFGEAAESIGAARAVKSLAAGATQIMADIVPNALKAIVGSTVCSKKGTDGVEGTSLEWLIPVACDLPRAVYNTIDSYERFKGIGRYADLNNWKISSDMPDTCKEVFADDFLETESTDEYDYRNQGEEDE